MNNSRTDIQRLIGNTLRWGVTIASVIAIIGLVIYLLQHGNESVPDYAHFDASRPAFTHLEGILSGFAIGESYGIIQIGIIVLILTPILRVALSFFDFLRERDWLYALISAIVLATIFINSVAGFK